MWVPMRRPHPCLPQAGGDDLRRGKSGCEGVQRGMLILCRWLRPPAVLPPGEHALELRHHPLGEEPRVVAWERFGRDAVLQQHEAADVQAGGDLAHLLRRLVRAADDDMAAADDSLHVAGRAGEALLRALAGGGVVLRRVAARGLGGSGDLAVQPGALRRLRHVAGRRDPASIPVQAAAAEVRRTASCGDRPEPRGTAPGNPPAARRTAWGRTTRASWPPIPPWLGARIAACPRDP